MARSAALHRGEEIPRRPVENVAAVRVEALPVPQRVPVGRGRQVHGQLERAAQRGMRHGGEGAAHAALSPLLPPFKAHTHQISEAGRFMPMTKPPRNEGSVLAKTFSSGWQYSVPKPTV